MIRQSEIQVDSVRYQRNGTDGTGFHVVAFRFRQGRQWTPLLAVMRSTETPDGEAFNHAEAAVICPADPRACWLGPDFSRALEPAVRAADGDGSAFR